MPKEGTMKRAQKEREQEAAGMEEAQQIAREGGPTGVEPDRPLPERRTLADVREWAAERRDHEYRNRPAPELTNTVGGGMSLGAVETLDALLAYLNGDDDA